MKNKLIMTAAAAALVGFSAANATAGPVSYANTAGSAIDFNGAGGFSFSPSLNSFVVTSGTAINLQGDMSGTFSIGIVSGNTAPVTGSGTLVIHDGATPLTGTLTWVNIVQTGTGSTLNDFGSINLTGVTYAGSNADLLALVGNAIDVLTFQFIPAQTLGQMKTTIENASFSGAIVAAPDGGTTVGLLGLALAVCGVFARKFKHA